jgi:hypothetical protein
MTDNKEQSANKKPASIQITALAMAALVPLYIILGYVMTRSAEMVAGPQGSEALDDIIAFPLGIIALIAPILAAWQMDRRSISEIQNLDPKTKAEVRMQKLMERRIIAFTLRLAPGVTGLGLTIMRMEFFWVGIMGGASLIAMILTWPSTECYVPHKSGPFVSTWIG